MSQFPHHVDPALIAELQHFRKLEATPPHDDIKMDLPEGAHVKTENGTWKVRWRKFQFFIRPLSREDYDSEVALLNEPASGPYAHFYSRTVGSVSYGAVKGVKRVQLVREVGSKSVEYALEVPGGFAHAAIIRHGMAWEESDWEKYFPSIEMIRDENCSAP